MNMATRMGEFMRKAGYYDDPEPEPEQQAVVEASARPAGAMLNPEHMKGIGKAIRATCAKAKAAGEDPLGVGEIAGRLGVPTNKVATNMPGLKGIVRSGERGHYRYTTA